MMDDPNKEDSQQLGSPIEDDSGKRLAVEAGGDGQDGDDSNKRLKTGEGDAPKDDDAAGHKDDDKKEARTSEEGEQKEKETEAASNAKPKSAPSPYPTPVLIPPYPPMMMTGIPYYPYGFPPPMAPGYPYPPMMMFPPPATDPKQMQPVYPSQAGVQLTMAMDHEHLSEYQLLVRQQLELFEATRLDVESNTQGRKKAVSLGQVGVRCRHCAMLPLRSRSRGAVYYPTKLEGIYQAAQNMAASHLTASCPQLPPALKAEMERLRLRRDNASGGKQYWADGARALGLYESDGGLRMRRKAPAGSNTTEASPATEDAAGTDEAETKEAPEE